MDFYKKQLEEFDFFGEKKKSLMTQMKGLHHEKFNSEN